MYCFDDIFKKIFKDKSKLIIILFCSMYFALSRILNSYLTGKIVEYQNIKYLLFYVVIIISGYIANYLLTDFVNKQVYNYSTNFFDSFLNTFFTADFKEITKYNNEIITSVSDSITHIRYFTETFYFSFTWRLLMIIISIFIFLYYSPIISLMIIISTILIGFYLKYISTLMDKRWQNYLDKLHKFEKTFQNVMLNIWNIKYNSLEYIINNELIKSFDKKSLALLDFKNLDFFIYKGPSMIFLITSIFNLYLIIKMKNMKISTRVFLILQMFSISKYIENLSSVLVDKYQNIKNIEKICPVWILKPKDCKEIKINKIYKIEFKNVSYSFGDGRRILNNLNFTINKNEIVSLNAKSGKGKSTIINLICRLYDINKGEILINNINIKDIDLESLRKQISVVPQNIILFNASLKSNIILNEKYDKNKLNKLVEILKLPDLNKNGLKISHGQKQRVLIARILYNTKKSLYIFDEPLSAVDYETAIKIQKYILKFLKENNKLGIFISHNDKFEKLIKKKINID